MNFSLWCTGGVLALSLLAGCDNPKSPDAHAKEVAATEEVAAREQSRAEQKAVTQVESADETAAKAASDVKMATADGTHKIAVEKCEALSGEALKDCKAQADADYAAAKTDAKSAGTH